MLIFSLEGANLSYFESIFSISALPKDFPKSAPTPTPYFLPYSIFEILASKFKILPLFTPTLAPTLRLSPIFFLEAAATGRVQRDNFEEQKISLKNIGDILRVGAKVGVNNGSILNLDAKISNIEYGRKYGVGVGADFGKSFGNAEIEKIDSKYDKFAPSSEKISIEAGFRQPVGEIVIYGSKSRDEYNQTTTEKNDFGVKMRMVLW